MSYVGDFALESTFDVKFTTRRFTTAAPFALASGVISAYVGNSTTQLTAGISLTADFDTVTGLNNVRVVATAANGYATASNYQLVITTGTVDSVSVVGEVIGQFSIEARSAIRPTVAARTLDVSAGGEAGVDWANVGSPTTALNLSATNIDVDQIVASVSGAVGSVTGAVGSVTGAVGSVTAAVTLPTIPTAWITADGIAANAIGASELATDAVAEIADQVWDEVLSGHVGAGSSGEALAAAGTAGDPWLTAIPGAYGAGTAGSRLGKLPDVTAGAAGGVFIAGTNAATAITTGLTTTFTGNLTGSVGSVTGAVGSVTGAVGSVATGGIAAASFAAGAINAAAIAADAITDAKVASDVTIASVTGAVGSVTGAVGSVTGAVGSVTGLTASNLDATISSRATPVQVNAEVVDALATDTYAEPAQGAPAATTTLAAKINYLFKAWRNKTTQTATEYKLFNDDALTVDHKASTSDDATTYSRGEVATGP